MAGVLELERLLVRIMADATQHDRVMGGVVKTLNRVSQVAAATGRALTVGVTTPIAALGTMAVKAASDFQSSFAGVRKTVDATEGQFAELSRGFRDMALQIPVNVNELNKIGEAAGQLGIKRENILGFTRVMADLGVATNLAGDEGATQLAKFANIVQMSQGNFERLGSTIVALGNNFATTERDIVNMSMRIAGSGKLVGMTESQIMGMATALSAVGIEAEMGGSAISKAMLTMFKQVSSGGKNLQKFAAVAGMTTQQFSQSFRQDAAGSVMTFIEGLGKLTDAGVDVATILEELDLDAQRMTDVILRASGSGQLLRDSMQLANQAWKDNNALSKEAAERYKTFASQMTVLKNGARDLAIDIGNVLIPVIQRLNVHLSAALAWFRNLSDTQKQNIVIIGAIAAAAGPLLLIFAKLTSTLGFAVIGMKALAGAFTVLKAGGMIALLPFVKIIVVLAAVSAAITGLVVLINRGFVGAWESVASAVSKIPDLFSKLTQNAMVAISTITRMFAALAGWLGNQLPLIFQKLAVDFAISIAGWAQKGLPIVTAFVLDANAIFQKFSKAVFTIFLDLLTSLGSMFNRLGPVLRDMLKSILTLDSQDFAKATMQIGIELAKEFNTVSSAASVEFAKATQGIGINVATAMDQLQRDVIRGAGSGDIFGTLGDIWQEGASQFVPLWETNTAAIADAADAAGGSIGGVVDSVMALQQQVAKPLQIAGVEGIAASSAEAVRMIAMAQMGAGTAIEAATRAATIGGGGPSIAVSRTEGEMVVTPRSNPAMKSESNQYQSKVLEYLRQLVENTSGEGGSQSAVIEIVDL